MVGNAVVVGTGTLVQRTLPRRVLLIGDFFATLAQAVFLPGADTQRFIPGRWRPRLPSLGTSLLQDAGWRRA
jgi:hypothetical protein